MNFQQLEYVLAVHKHKHFAIAAESCHITQATLSAMIKKLEEELGIILFDRSRKPVQTTDIGLEFIQKAGKILNDKAELYNFKTTPDTIQGKLTIGIIPTVANSLLPLILPSILKENPELKLTVIEITTEEIKSELAMDKIDIGILSTPIEDKRFEEHILYYESMMVYGINDINKNYVTSSDVKDGDVWLLDEGHCFREQSITICDIKAKEMEETNLVFKGSSFETLLNLTDEFGGYTLLPELYYNQMTIERKQCTKAFQKPIPVREISMITYRQYAKNRSIEYLTKLIQDKVNPLLKTTEKQNKDLEIIGI